MQNNEKIYKFLTSYLFQKEIALIKFSKEEEKFILDASNHLMLSGFLLNSKSNIQNKNLEEQLKQQKKLSTMKYMMDKNNLLKISNKFKESDLKPIILKGFSLNLNNVYPPGIRFSKDIDILIEKENISEAYRALREVGYKYYNKCSKDKSKILNFHQLPVMMNEDGTLIELHWRLTRKDIFINCPITEHAFNKKIKINGFENLYSLDNESLITHLFYHGVIHDEKRNLLLLLFDLCKAYEAKKFNFPEFKLMEKVKLKAAFSLYLDLIKKIIDKKDNNKNIIRKIMKLTANKKKNEGFYNFFVFLKRLRKKFRYTSYYYQTHFYEPIFLYFLLIEFYKSLKKLFEKRQK